MTQLQETTGTNRLGTRYPGTKTQTKEYWAWYHAIRRCTNPKHRQYPNYGGRGIGMYPGWIRNYEGFIAHIGAAPSAKHSLDRIDNSRGYEPGNVRWATVREQLLNRRCLLTATVGGVTRPLIEWCEDLGAPYPVVKERIVLGWDPARALTTPVHVKGNKRDEDPAMAYIAQSRIDTIKE